MRGPADTEGDRQRQCKIKLLPYSQFQTLALAIPASQHPWGYVESHSTISALMGREE